MALHYIIAVTDRAKHRPMAALFDKAGLRPILTNLGNGTARSEHLALYGLDSTEKAVVSTVANDEDTAELIRTAKEQLYMDIPGNGVMLAIPIKSVAGGRTLNQLSGGKDIGGKPKMEFKHELIIAILNEGQSDSVMNAAREAGATGGTVLHAKGTGSRETGKFLSVSIAEEKDMVYIVAKAGEKAAIMRSINEKAGPGTRAGAICFSLPISAVVGLRENE